MKSLIKSMFISGFVVFISCADVNTNHGEDYGDILQTTDGLTLTEAEHAIGWQRSDCTSCHNLENIHLENRTSLAIDIDAVHEQAIEEGEDGCTTCHGTNGL